MPSGSIDVSAPAGSATGTITFQAGSLAGATVSVAASSLLGSVHAYGSDVAITSSQAAATGDLSVQNVVAYKGNVAVTATAAKLTVIKSQQSSAAISATGNVSLTGDGIAVALGTPTGDDFIQAGKTGAPGNITLATTSTSNADITLGSNLKADGTITLSAHGSGNVLGSAGAFVLPVTAGANNTLHVSTASGSIGNIIADSPLKTNVKNLTASTASSGAGVIDIVNSSGSASDTLNLSNTLSGGDVSILTGGLLSVSDVTVTSGKITLRGNGVTVLDTSTGLSASSDIEVDTLTGSDADINLLGKVSTGTTVTLQAQGIGDILTNGGMVGPTSTSGQPNLVLRTVDGSVGLISNPFITSVSSVDALGTSLTGGSIHLKNTTGVVHSPLTLNNVIYANSVAIESDGTVNIVGSIESTSVGDIEIFSDIGTLNDIGLNQIIAYQGDIRLYTLDTSGGLNGGQVIIGLSANVITEKGNIYIFRGAKDPTQQAGVAAVPPVIQNGGQVFWGGPYGTPPNEYSITATGQQIFVEANGATVTFQASGDPTKITLNSNSTISANH